MSLDASIIAQLQSLKANAGAPMMGGPPRPGQPTPSMPGMQPGMMPGMPVPQMPPQAMGAPAQGGPPPGSNVLSVAVNNLPFRYQLAEADVREMCQRWGMLQNVVVYRDGQREVGVAIFADPVDASDCARQLSGKLCSFDSPGGPAQGSLAVVLGGPEQLAGPRMQGGPNQFAGPGQGPPMGVGPMGGPPQMAPMGGQPGFPPQGPPMQPMGGMPMQGGMGAPDAMMGKGNGKGPQPQWSAKVIVHAERLHPEFPAITKICGVGGQNMDHIRSQGNCNVELRGQKSGTIDARTGQELPEPMFLLLTSDVPDSGLAALEMVKDLLGSVYEEHATWCAQQKLQWSENLQPQVIENPHLTEGV